MAISQARDFVIPPLGDEDGDFDSAMAMASAGHGMDEDFGQCEGHDDASY